MLVHDTQPGNEVGLFYNAPEPTQGERYDDSLAETYAGKHDRLHPVLRLHMTDNWADWRHQYQVITPLPTCPVFTYERPLVLIVMYQLISYIQTAISHRRHDTHDDDMMTQCTNIWQCWIKWHNLTHRLSTSSHTHSQLCTHNSLRPHNRKQIQMYFTNYWQRSASHCSGLETNINWSSHTVNVATDTYTRRHTYVHGLQHHMSHISLVYNNY